MTMPTHYGERGMLLTTTSEGLRTIAYRDQGGVWTFGYGHTGKDVFEGAVVTHANALVLLHSDLAAACHCVQQAVKVPLNQNQFDALVDFAFNAGRGSFLRSTLLVRLNRGCYAEVPALLRQWVYCDGQVDRGLQRRREAEAKLFQEAA